MIPSPLAGQQAQCQAHQADLPLLLSPSLPGRAHSPCLPGYLLPLPARQRCSAITKGLPGPMFMRRKTSLSPSCKGCSEGIMPTEDTQDGRSPVSSTPQILFPSLDQPRRHTSKTRHLTAAQPPAFLPAGGNCSARISAPFSSSKAAAELEGRGSWWPYSSPVTSPRHMCCSKRGRWPGPRCQGAGVLPRRLNSAPDSRWGRGMLA